jgi:hypothetical protein
MNKRQLSLLAGGFLFFVVIACTIPGTRAGTDADINVGIDVPKSGDTLPMGPVRIVFSASSSAGISEVELSVNNAVMMRVLNEDGQSISVSEFIWTPESPGETTIRVRAKDNAGNWSGTVETRITIEAGGLVPTATTTGVPAVIPTATSAPPPAQALFRIFDVKTDRFTFYYGDDDCGPNEITITAKVNYTDQVKGLVLFTRFADQESFETTSWDSGRSMSKISDDTYRITLKAEDIPNYNKYEFATLFYQIVATREGGGELGRTTAFKNAHLEICPQPNTPADVRFKNYSYDTDIFFYGGSSCGDNQVVISTDVTRPEKAEYVILFTRFKDINSDKITNWDKGTTLRVIDENTHRITLRPETLANYDEYDFARMSYQFIAVDKDKKITGRSLVFDDILLARCR